MNSKSITPDNSLKVYEWTSEEKQLFDNAMAELDPSSPDFYANVAYRIPWKSIDEVKEHYHQLVGDTEKIESHVHDQMPTLEDGQEKHEESMESESEMKKHEEASPDESETMGVSPSPAMENVERKRQRRKSIPWTLEEHQLFLFGLDAYGKGKWKNISQNCVSTKTPAQVASHAQKFFARLRLNTPLERRRPSINDTGYFFPSSSQYNSPNVRSEFLSNGGILNNNSNLIFPPQNGSPNIQNHAVCSNPHQPRGFTQNHNLSYSGDFTDSGLISTHQNGFPNVGNEVAFAHSYTHQGGVDQNLNSNHNGSFSSLTQSVVDSSLVFPPQNGFPNIAQPHPSHGSFPQNLNSMYNHAFVNDSSFVSPPQRSFPGVGNESAAFAHHHPRHGGVQNLYFNQNAEFPGVDKSIINSNPTFPPQNVIPNIGEEISFSQPHLHGSTQNSDSYYNHELLNSANCYDSASFLPSGSSSGSTNAYQPYDENYRHE